MSIIDGRGQGGPPGGLMAAIAARGNGGIQVGLSSVSLLHFRFHLTSQNPQSTRIIG
jgi:hypothetical protein